MSVNLSEPKRAIVKYHNDLYDKLKFVKKEKIDANTYKEKPLSSREIRIFMAIVYKVGKEQRRTVFFTPEEIKYLTGNKYASDKEFIKVCKQATEALGELNITIDREKEGGRMNLFQTIYYNEYGMACSVNENFKHLFVDVFEDNPKGYSKILLSMVNKTNRYGQLLAMLLVKYRGTNECHITLEDFKRWMVIPNSYPFKKIREKVLDPAVKELSKYFKGLHYVKHTKQKKVTGLSFFFTEITPSIDKTYEKLEIVNNETGEISNWYGEGNIPHGFRLLGDQTEGSETVEIPF